ncbi:MAG: RluA family pseudouridine synthase [Chlamydiales bacterium]|nr:RluA family pseudouridine synthase [Chlamydiales bacterium]
MHVIYEDNHLLIIDKKSGMPTQDDGKALANATDIAKDWIKKVCDKKGAVFLEPIHRLDKPVSGLLLFARTSKALSRLQQAMRERKICKWYYALVEKAPSEKGVLEDFLIHDSFCAKVVAPSHPLGKKAILSYQVLKEVPEGFLLEIELETGRYHQIRAQLSAAGSPIIGDRKYGSSLQWKKDAIALHHGKLAFVHPVTQEAMEFTVVPSFGRGKDGSQNF